MIGILDFEEYVRGWARANFYFHRIFSKIDSLESPGREEKNDEGSFTSISPVVMEI